MRQGALRQWRLAHQRLDFAARVACLALIALAARRSARSAEDTPRSNTIAKFGRAAMKAKPSQTRTGRKVANRDHPWRGAEAGGASRPRFRSPTTACSF